MQDLVAYRASMWAGRRTVLEGVPRMKGKKNEKMYGKNGVGCRGSGLGCRLGGILSRAGRERHSWGLQALLAAAASVYQGKDTAAIHDALFKGVAGWA